MKRALLTLAAVLTFVTAAFAGEKSKTCTFGTITGIDASFTYEIHVTDGASDKVRIVYDSDYEDYMKIDYSLTDSRLHLNMGELPRKVRNSDHAPIKVYLQMKKVKDIDLSGAASAYFEGVFSADRLDMDISGAAHVGGPFQISGRSLSIDASGASKAVLSGDFQTVDLDISGASDITFSGNGSEMEGEMSGAAEFRFKGSYDECSIECSGAANLDMSGEGRKIELEGSGACNMDTKDYYVREATVELSGASKAKVSASEELLLDVDRSSRLTYYGNPAVRNISSDSNIIRGDR